MIRRNFIKALGAIAGLPLIAKALPQDTGSEWDSARVGNISEYSFRPEPPTITKTRRTDDGDYVIEIRLDRQRWRMEQGRLTDQQVKAIRQHFGSR